MIEPVPSIFQTNVAWLPPGSSVSTWLGDDPVDDRLTTAAFVFAFDTPERLLLSNVRKRGLDIPGGHVEPGETPDMAAMRECREETGASIQLLGKVGHLRLDVPNPPKGYRYPTPQTFQVFYAAAVLSMGPVEMPEECSEPMLVGVADFMARRRFELQRALVPPAAALFTAWHDARLAVSAVQAAPR